MTVLRLNEDDLARQTKARLLIQLNKFAEVAEVVQEDEGLLLQRAYALYKLGREKAALELIEGKTEDDRGLRALEAQIVRVLLSSLSISSGSRNVQRYKLEEYQSSADIYEELLDAADIVCLFHLRLSYSHAGTGLARACGPTNQPPSSSSAPRLSLFNTHKAVRSLRLAPTI